MGYRQAFHTSCRKGLSGHAGFQFNAASPDLDQERLTRIAADHSGYRPPPDAPPEPDAAEIAALPVDLRYLPVEGVGPVVSRTAYVGREFRGVGGEPDSGRFGNYFSHVVVGDGDDPFGGLLPIELWGAPHWTTAEAEGTELSPLAEVEPGDLDLDRVLARLSSRGSGVLAAVSDAALRAVLGGPRVVIVEAEPDLAAAWVAWASFALPPDRTSELTFATFEGRPRVAESVRICVTTPGCDVDFPPYELQSTVVVIDSTAPPPPVADLSLYGRVLGALADEGAEAVAAAVRDLPAGLDLASAGAELAVAARRADLARADDLPGVLAVLRACLGRVPAGSLAEMATRTPAGDGLPATFAAWSELYAAARRSDDPEAPALVDAALERLLDSLGDPPVALPAVDSDGPAVPSAGVLVKWLGSVSEAAGTERLGPILSAGARLGLVGCNNALDKELVAPTAAGFADPKVQAAYAEIARAGGTRLVEGVALELAGKAGEGRGVELLRRAAAEPPAREAVRANAAERDDFESVAAWELLRADSGDSTRPAAVAALAARAETAGHEAAIRGLYGAAGPAGPEQHAELLGGWEAAGREAPVLDYESALACLGGLSFDEAKRVVPLFRVLRTGPRAVRGDPEYTAWSLLFEAAPERRPFRDWAEAASRLSRQADAGLSSAREEELRGLAARVAVQALAEDDHAQGIEILLRGMGREWPLQLGDALARRAEKSVNPQKQIARAFVTWGAQKRCREALLEVALPRATRDLSAKELEAVGASLGERRLPPWEDWLEDHPPRRAVSRAVRGVLRRGEDR